MIQTLQECVSKGGNLLLNIGPRVDGSIPEHTVEVFRRLGAWMKVNGEAIYGSKPVLGTELSEDVWMTMVWDDVYVFLPPMVEETPSVPEVPAASEETAAAVEAAEGDEPEEYYVLRFPGNLFDAIAPQILGQPDCRVEMRRVEESGGDEPAVFLELRIPYSAWDNAVEGLPVLKLANNS